MYAIRSYYGDSLQRFHKLKNGKAFELLLANRVYDYNFKVVDEDNYEPIPGAKVTIETEYNGVKKQWEGITEPDGTVYFENFPYCGQFELIATADGYLPDTLAGSNESLNGNEDYRTIPLTPQKEMIQFYVYDLSTRSYNFV